MMGNNPFVIRNRPAVVHDDTPTCITLPCQNPRTDEGSQYRDHGNGEGIP
ncbi:hypothetical protein FHW37_1064 [Neorhizobium alkalisoli]|uniref:Uncharacterized protein n=1 Tax=Neorhizobium alkalisoli TaxID=528178 RepID=A0A561QI46_9HYPH|nr:hypothetical protein FHW37_1064 [Neorhizobium alkalisoli]